MTKIMNFFTFRFILRLKSFLAVIFCYNVHKGCADKGLRQIKAAW